MEMMKQVEANTSGNLLSTIQIHSTLVSGGVQTSIHAHLCQNLQTDECRDLAIKVVDSFCSES